MLLTCPGCHHTFKHFARENTDKVKCFCGTEVPVDNVARFEFTCKQCGKTTWAGCGQHVDQVMRGVPKAQRCEGHEDEPGFLSKLFGGR